MNCVPISGHDENTTSGNESKNLVLFAGNPNSSINGRLNVICRRPSDGATKCWNFPAAMRVDGSGVPSNLANLTATAFGASGDLTILLLATIAFFAGGGNIGVTVNGVAGSDLEWCANFDGMQLID